MSDEVLVDGIGPKAAVSRYGLMLCLLLAMSLLLVAGCGGDGTGATIQLQSQATLVCSQECIDRGQCGTTLDGQTFVLGGAIQPVVDAHDRLFANNTLVVVNNSDIRTLQPVQPAPTGGEPFPHTFYQVTTIDSSKAGWVSSWCIAPQPQ
ncbi:MAG TPA: hypothetical protein VF177_17020 [Anaerolineae bacterium]